MAADTVLAFLKQLHDCTVIDVPGDDPQRTRIILTLLHGNEPSGLIALHRWLRGNHQPTTNLRFIIASVSVALHEPVFSHRFLPGEEDLNRCFNGTKNKLIGKRAEQITQLIRQCQPELIVDLHNTSGAGPAFCVARADGPLELALVSFFCERMILTHLGVGSLIEQDFGCPAVSIECGGATDSNAHEVAYYGIEALAFCDDFSLGHHFWPVQVLTQPLRIEVADGVTLAYGSENKPQADLCLVEHIEDRNMDITPAGYCLG